MSCKLICVFFIKRAKSYELEIVSTVDSENGSHKCKLGVSSQKDLFYRGLKIRSVL